MRVSRALLRRVERLETSSRSRVADPVRPEDQRWWQCVEQLLEKIDAEYAQQIRQELMASSLSSWSGLTLALLSRAADHSNAATPLAFPAAVAQIYRDDPQAGEEAACRECHYSLPARNFPRCPLCGGAVGFATRALCQN